jgi:hypothetical protein
VVKNYVDLGIVGRSVRRATELARVAISVPDGFHRRPPAVSTHGLGFLPFSNVPTFTGGLREPTGDEGTYANMPILRRHWTAGWL